MDTGISTALQARGLCKGHGRPRPLDQFARNDTTLIIVGNENHSEHHQEICATRRKMEAFKGHSKLP